jgi:GT2 family glycosyltransferase
MSRVAVVIVHHANPADTFACVESLLMGTRVPDKLIVVDNGNDAIDFTGTFEIVSNENGLVGLRHITTGHQIDWLKADNRGYAAALNDGIRSLQKHNVDYFWLLNNDLAAEPDALQRLIEFADVNKNKRLGLIGCKVKFYDRRDTLNAVGGRFFIWKAGGYNIGANQKDNGQFDNNNVHIDYPYGAAMLTSAAFINDIGLLDESYFLYFEELDWTVRGKRKGYQVGYCSACVVYHKQGASTGKQIKQAHTNAGTVNYQYGNLTTFYRKHYPLLLPIAYARLLALAAKRFSQNRSDEAKQILRIIRRGGSA